ncbi:MAG: hypothetical protein J3K34DRAFT_108965 [Monoraphidium minutum]|nr:MAG: hypothetical protein J3K34DRAFT_108965 [Monoraphidium minutum]
MSTATAEKAVADTAAPAAAPPAEETEEDKHPLRSLIEAVGEALSKAGIGKDGKAEAAASKVADKAEDASHTMSEIAGIITTLAKDSLGDLLVHPGHATIGVYYLARRHQMERLVEPMDGSHVGDAELIQDLMRYTDISESTYPDRYEELVVKGGLMKEEDIIFRNDEVHKLQPAFFIARDPARKKIMWVLRGTHDIHDILTDLCGIATPMPGGGYAHWGMWQSALWLLDSHLDNVLEALAAHPGYDLTIVGHSMGGGVGALVGHVLTTTAEVTAKLGGAKVECRCICPAAVMSSEIATGCGNYVTSLVMRYDLVPRFSTASMEQLKGELLQIDYKGLLSEDLMGNDKVKRAVEATTRAAERMRAQEAARIAHEKAAALLQQAHKTASHVVRTVAATPAAQAVGEKAQAVGDKVADHAAGLADKIDNALAKSASMNDPASDAAAAEAAAAAASAAEGKGLKGKVDKAADAALQRGRVRAALGWVSKTLKKATGRGGGGAAAAAPAAAAGAPGAAAEVHASDVGHEREAAEQAAAAGELVNVPLYAPGRIFWLRPIDDDVPEEEHQFQLVDTGCDHFPGSAHSALENVLSRIKAPAV